MMRYRMQPVDDRLWVIERLWPGWSWWVRWGLPRRWKPWSVPMPRMRAVDAIRKLRDLEIANT
jgi:hypothetical protein